MDMEHQNLDAEAEAMAQEFGPAPEVLEQQQQEQQQQATRERSAQEWASVLELALKPAAQILAPNWGITGDEIKMLAEAYGQCAAEYLPEVEQAGPWVGAVLVTGMVVAPRLGTPRKLPPPKDDTESHTDSQGGSDAD